MQAMIPFDDEELEYIARLDARADAELLRRELPSLRDSCLRTMEVSTTLLQVRLALNDLHRSTYTVQATSRTFSAGLKGRLAHECC